MFIYSADDDRDVELAEYVEGRTRLLVPAVSIAAKGPPPMLPAFFNPLAAVTRDFAVLFYAVRASKSNLRLLDVLSGIGARGIRVANESGSNVEVHLNDANGAAVEVALKNCELNGLVDRCAVSKEDANVLMYSAPRHGIRFNAIDVDPFGSPVPFADAALSTVSLGGIVALTATDLSALTGRSWAAGRRKYGVSLWRTDFSREVAARALAGYAVTRAASRERGARPLFAHVDSQYARVYLELYGSARAADESLEHVGYLEYCPRCLYRGVSASGQEYPRTCPVCGGELRELGPLWLGDILDREHVEGMLRAAEERGWPARSRILRRMLQEMGMPPYYYSLDRVADSLGICVPRMEALLEALTSKGYKAVRSGMHELGVRTDAPHKVVVEEMRGLSRC